MGGGWIGANQILVLFQIRLDTKVNSLDMQLCEFTYMTRLTTKQDIATQYIGDRIEVTESGARGDTEMIPVVPFICKKVRLRLEECGCNASQTNNHGGFTQISCEQRHEGLAHFH